MPGVEADNYVDGFHTFRLGISASNLTYIGVDGRIALEDGDEQGDGGADQEEHHEHFVGDHPVA